MSFSVYQLCGLGEVTTSLPASQDGCGGTPGRQGVWLCLLLVDSDAQDGTEGLGIGDPSLS